MMIVLFFKYITDKQTILKLWTLLFIDLRLILMVCSYMSLTDHDQYTLFK
uniref:Uncharacterized protein n=1 Tax=Arundo donax TaxID=35708 RepID=A0A0A9A088_ARUDO